MAQNARREWTAVCASLRSSLYTAEFDDDMYAICEKESISHLKVRLIAAVYSWAKSRER